MTGKLFIITMSLLITGLASGCTPQSNTPPKTATEATLISADEMNDNADSNEEIAQNQLLSDKACNCVFQDQSECLDIYTITSCMVGHYPKLSESEEDDFILTPEEQAISENNEALQARIKLYKFNLRRSVRESSKQLLTLMKAAKADASKLPKLKNEAMLYAARFADANIIKALLSVDVSSDAYGPYGSTALAILAARNDPESLQALVEAGVTLNNQNSSNDTALMIATRNNDTQSARILIDAGADVNITGTNHIDALYLAISNDNAEIAKALIAADADVDHRDEHQNTPLIQAVITDDLEIVQALLDAGADVNAQNDNGITAMMWTSDPTISQALLDHQIPDQANSSTDTDETPSMKRAIDLELKDNNGETAIIHIANQNNAEIVKQLADAGADLNVMSIEGDTLLTYAIRQKHDETTRVLLNAAPQININAMDKDHSTPLYYAIHDQNADLVKELLALGADPNTDEDDNYSTLIEATSQGQFEIVQSLVEAKANLEAQNQDGYTPLLIALDKPYQQIAKFLIESHANVNARNVYGETPLMFALENDSCAYNNIEIIQSLLAAGADITATDNNNEDVFSRITELTTAAVVNLLNEAKSKHDENQAQ